MLNSFAQMFRILLLHSIQSQRKCLLVLFVLLILIFCCNNVVLGKCISDSSCMNGGICTNATCICPDGWQGDDCQFCGGKVRLTDFFGYIHDGAGNYSVGVKCSWLIDAREHSLYRNSLRSNDKQPTIRLHVEEFATECGWDHLYVFDGDSVESPLLAVYSGLMYSQNVSVRRVPEVVARSGSVLLHFFSDDAYNMSGFNISYKINGCPTDDSSVNCSGHGICNELNGTCDCDNDYYGFACQTPKCPNDCSKSLGRGRCDGNRCVCTAGYAGVDCNQDVSLGHWTTITPDSYTPAGSASHSAAVWGDALHIIAGESYGRGELLYTYDFNGKVWETVHSAGTTSPERRFDASTVIYGDKIYMYGGVVGRKGVSNELWAFDVSAKTWENITVKYEPCASANSMCGPLKASGHTATLVPGHDSATNTEYKYMIVIFGHSPQYGYLNTVQEYTFSTRTWKILTTYGYPVKGGYGHSADYDPLTNKVYIYGGIVSENENNQIISNNLYSYDPKTREWKLLTAALSGRFLHTANFISSGLMMVFGGNTHNDTSHSFGAKCYSNELMVYDVLCDTWHFHTMPDDFRTDVARFGHSAVKFSDSLYIYGGFDGQMLSDLLKYTPGNCHALQKAELCLNARPGHKCVWDIQKSKCIPITHVQKDIIRARDQDIYLFCPKESRNVLTQQLLLDSSRCSELLDCHSCVSTSFGCTFCSTGMCSKDKCRDYHSDGIPIQSVSISSLDKCPEDIVGLQCAQLHDCNACQASPSKCHWDGQLNKCRIASNRSVDDPFVCGTPCAEINSCSNCTSEECIWCQNEMRCVDKNAYTVSFPYGQCREWTTQLSKCRAPTSGGGKSSQCEFYKSCVQCRDDPACGWCDDGSNTGLGKCYLGGDSGPQDPSECPIPNWFFTRCPSCQCNGHSTCYDGKTCSMPCNGLTTGPNCETCKPGYWGNPINGGTCNKCECNGQATHCHSETAKCYCSTKGLTGDHCEKCDGTNHYHGDPSKGSCYYDLTIDYQFTFNLSKKEDRHFTQINFRNSPIKSDIDADFSILCSVAAKMNITIRSAGGPEKVLFSNLNCSQFRYRFSKTDHHFGIEDNITLTTFYVYVYDFQPPVWIQIAFSQYPKLNLQQFFITFSTCFLLLLLLAAVLWKIKQKYDMYRRRQRLFVEMEQMASRPFSEVLVEIETRRADADSPTAMIENISRTQRKRKKNAPSPIALEPCNGNRAAVLSLLVRLPSGGLNYSTCGQSTGLAIASALVTLGNPRKLSMEHPKETKNKRKQSQHPDNCI